MIIPITKTDRSMLFEEKEMHISKDMHQILGALSNKQGFS